MPGQGSFPTHAPDFDFGKLEYTWTRLYVARSEPVHETNTLDDTPGRQQVVPIEYETENFWKYFHSAAIGMEDTPGDVAPLNVRILRLL